MQYAIYVKRVGLRRFRVHVFSMIRGREREAVEATRVRAWTRRGALDVGKLLADAHTAAAGDLGNVMILTLRDAA